MLRREKKVGGGGRGREGAVSAPVDEWERGAGVGEGAGEGIDAGIYAKVDELEREVKRLQRREASLKKQLQMSKELEVMVWAPVNVEGKEGDSSAASQEVIGQLRSRLQAARRLLSSMGRQLQQEVESRIGAEEEAKRRDKVGLLCMIILV